MVLERFYSTKEKLEQYTLPQKEWDLLELENDVFHKNNRVSVKGGNWMNNRNQQHNLSKIEDVGHPLLFVVPADILDSLLRGAIEWSARDCPFEPNAFVSGQRLLLDSSMKFNPGTPNRESLPPWELSVFCVQYKRLGSGIYKRYQGEIASLSECDCLTTHLD